MNTTLAPLAVSLIFLVALVSSVTAKFWLLRRQVKNVALHRSAVPEQFKEKISLESHQKAADYTIAKSQISLFDIALSTLFVVGLTLLGGLQWIHDWLYAIGNTYGWHTIVTQLAIFAVVAVIGTLIDLPLSLWKQFGVDQRFGFNRMTWKLYLADTLKSTALGVLIGAPLLALILWLMQTSGPQWWLYTFFVWMGFNLLVMLIFPTFIAPLFNKFVPLQEGDVKTRVEQLLARCGFTSKGLFVMDGSKRSSHGNAYFTGMGSSKRIVFFDTLIERLSINEIEAVLAHELGHFKHKHIVKRIVTIFAMSFFALALLGWLSTQAGFYKGLGVAVEPTLWPAIALILFMYTLPYFSFWLAPIASASSRKHEFEADAYAASQTNASDLVSALTKLYQDNAATLTPDRLHSRFYDSHPPATERIAQLKKLSPTA
jgi:STE24 endopeptidase